MSHLRPECATSKDPALPYDTALYLIKNAVERRGSLVYGQLNDKRGGHCAIGAFWADNPGTTLTTDLIDEVAAVNDSVPPTATPKERWLTVRRWLRWKVRTLAVKASA